MPADAVPCSVSTFAMCCVLPAANAYDLPDALTRLRFANVVSPAIEPAAAAPSTKSTWLLPRTNMPESLQLPNKEIVLLPASSVPPLAMVTSDTSCSTPDPSCTAPETCKATPPRSTDAPARLNAAPAGTDTCAKHGKQNQSPTHAAARIRN